MDINKKERKKEYLKLYYIKNKELIKEKRKKYTTLYCLKNKDRKKEYDKIYKAKHKEKIKADRIKNKEHIKKINKAWREKNKDILKNKKAEYFQKNKEFIRYKAKIYKNIPAVKEMYKVSNKVRSAKYTHKKRVANSRMTMLDEFVFSEAIKLRMIRDKTFNIKWHIDHIIPISKEGTNSYDNIQVVPAVWNLSKNNKHSKKFFGGVND